MNQRSDPAAAANRGAILERLILWLALAGMVLAVHLWIQKARGFDQGCLGVFKPAAVEEVGGCEEVGALPASHLFGVSNAAWGYAFYFGLALLSWAKILAAPAWARRAHRAGEVGVTFALLYSAYLVYQMGFVAHAWCVLCLGSAALVAALAALHLALRRRGRFQPAGEAERTADFRAAVGAGFAAGGLLLGVLLFVDRLGTRPLDQGSTGRELVNVVGRALPTFIDAEKLQEMRACHLDRSASVLDVKKFIGAETPFLGAADGIPVFVFYDPNCGHCKAYDPVFRQLAEKFGGRARFYVLPRPLWAESIPQVAALKLAEPSGKYFELWQRMFAAQRPGQKGLSTEEIARLFRELGLDDRDLARRLRAAERGVVAFRDLAQAAGIDSVPAIYINGRKVWGQNRSEACIGTLIDRRIAAEKEAPVNRP